MAIALALIAGLGHAQQTDANPAPLPPVALASLHGVVRNTATGEPLPRVLVSVNGESGNATLTDGDGRYEIDGVAPGPNVVTLTRPGFEDAAGGDPGMATVMGSYAHSVVVEADMPQVDFAMRPTNAIQGQIQLSTGEPAENITVTLLERAIQDGRAEWRPRDTKRTNADGAYRFAGLPDGVYAIAAVDSELELAEMVNSPTAVVEKFAAMYYPDARDFSGAGRIRLAAGNQVQANLTLLRERFHLVKATVTSPTGAPVGSATRLPSGAIISVNIEGQNIPLEIQSLSGIEVKVTDLQGHVLPYPGAYDSATRTIHAMLPDGNYTLRASAFRPNPPVSGASTFRVNTFMYGQADISVVGHSVTNLRVPVAPEPSSSLQVLINRTQPETSSSSPDNGGLYISASPAGPGVTDPAQAQFAQGPAEGTLDTSPLAPGSYWLHTSLGQGGLCESSFTAGGANLGREPLVVGSGGSTPPLTLTLRDDCASLKMSLPGSVAGIVVGEEQAYTVYLIPDFDSTTEARSITLRASTGGSFTFNSLTPGSYRVYTFTAPVNLEYRNPEALAALPNAGQQVTLSPGATGSLVVEVPQP